MFIITPDSTAIGLNVTRFFPDAFTQVNYGLSWSAPTKPVANGFVKSQGIFKNLNTVALSGCVAGISLNKQGVDPFENAPDRTIAACNMIEAMGDAGDCVTINPGDGKIFENMALVAAPIRFDVGGVMSFDLLFQELRPFDVSETFDGTLGQAVNIGEVTTQTGQPVNGPTIFDEADVNLLSEQVRNDALIQCTNDCTGANQTCLDDCYARFFEGG